MPPWQQLQAIRISQPKWVLLRQLGTGHEVIERELGSETREPGSNPALLTRISEQVTESHLASVFSPVK